jgi:hypothetical protein
MQGRTLASEVEATTEPITPVPWRRTGENPKITMGMVKIYKLRREAIWAICAVFTIALLWVSFTWIDKAQMHDLNYTFTSTASNILKAYVSFTEIQFLIINKNQFDWTNVRVEVSSDISQDYPVHGTIDPRAFMLMVPRMNSGEAYPVGVTRLRREDGAMLEPVTTRPEHIKICSDTPHGRGFWYGSFVQPSAVADSPLPLAEPRFQP